MDRTRFKGAAHLKLFDEIVKRWRRAAEQGYAKAQFELGASHANGQGLKQDDCRALMWLSLAAEQGHENATTMRVKLKRRMTPEQIEEAYALMREWKQKYPLKPPKRPRPLVTSQVSKPSDSTAFPRISDRAGAGEIGNPASFTGNR
jgi:TPR repeat protein